MQPTPIEIELMYNEKEENRMKAGMKYSKELESKGILTLIAAATQYHDMIVSTNQQIGLQTSPDLQTKVERTKMFKNNWNKLNQYYQHENLQNYEYVPKNITQFLIKWWWMGYKQCETVSNPYFTWNRIIFELKELSKTAPGLKISVEHQIKMKQERIQRRLNNTGTKQKNHKKTEAIDPVLPHSDDLMKELEQLEKHMQREIDTNMAIEAIRESVEKRLNIPQCIDSFAFPCTMDNSVWNYVFNSSHIGSSGHLYRAREKFANGSLGTTEYMMKFIKREIASSRSSIFLALSETFVITELQEAESVDLYKKYLIDTYPVIFELLTNRSWEWMSSPTIAVCNSDTRYDIDAYLDTSSIYEYAALLMDYHPLENVKDIIGNTALLSIIKQNPDGHIWKLLVDMSFIMNYMNNEKNLYDTNLRLENILISGYCPDYRMTSYIKIDYANVLSKDIIVGQLNSNDSDTRCNFARMPGFVKFKIYMLLFSDF